MTRQVAKNAAWNILGVGLPILAGLLAVPLLLHGLGQARFGVFSLALGLFGFAGIFDLGLGRALTQTVATELGKGSPQSAIAGLARKALLAVFALGAAWGLVLWLSAAALTHDLFHLDGQIATETILGMYWLAVTLPIALVSTSLIGILEGTQRFKQVNFLRAPLGIAIFIIPALVAQFTDNLGWVIASLALVRVFGLVLWGGLLLRHFPLFARFNGAALATSTMWRFSGWLSVSNLVGPFMVHADRFYLASVFPPATVALYTVPLDALFRAATLPSAAVNAAFPALAHLGAQGEAHAARKIIHAAGMMMLVLWLLPLLLAGALLPFLLDIWLGNSFAAQIIEIAQWILLGVLLNGFAYIPYALLQSAGRTDLTAKLHLIELPLYALALFYFVAAFGIVGAAIAWFARVALDTTMLYLMAAAQFASLRTALLQLTLGTVVSGLGLALIFMFQSHLGLDVLQGNE